MRVFVSILALIVMFAADAAEAKRAKNQYAFPRQPYWRVGILDKALTSACQKGNFGQIQHMRLTIGFIGGEGRAITGIATNVWNLRDPKNLRQPNTTYHFYNQGYSNCKVYVSPTPRPRR